MNQPDNDKKMEQLHASDSQLNEEKVGINKQDELPNDDKSSDFPFLDDVPPEVRRDVKRAFQIMMTSSMGGPSHNPLLDKFKDEHIHKYLDYIQRDDDHLFELRSSSRWFHSFYILLGLGSFLFLVIYLAPLDKVLLSDIIKILVSFAGGLGSGFGLKAYLDKK